MMVNGPILPMNMRTESMSLAGTPKEGVVPLIESPVSATVSHNQKNFLAALILLRALTENILCRVGQVCQVCHSRLKCVAVCHNGAVRVCHNLPVCFSDKSKKIIFCTF